MSMPPEKALLICTGSQGETRSALYKLARGENKTIKLGENDVVLFSSKIIPGNELGIRDMQNLLISKGVTIVTTETESDIHVSGHPDKESLVHLYKWLSPKAFIPIHGDKRLLWEHAEFAKSNGIPEILLAESGDKIKLSHGKLQKISNKEIVLGAIDGNDIISLNSETIRERAIMSYNGHVSISFIVSDNKEILEGPPNISVSGIHIDEENMIKLRKIIYQIIETEINKSPNNEQVIKRECQSTIRRLFLKHFAKKPIVDVHIHEI
jgi:ribonuclease J